MKKTTKALLIYFFVCVCALQSLSEQKDVERDYPPSKYIGIFDWYDGFKNGEFPGTNALYSGHWSQRHYNGSVSIEGMYSNGIPVGVWSSYLANGRVQNRVWYDADNSLYLSVSYYPDLLPRSIERGHYAFKDGRYGKKLIENSNFDPIGRLFAGFDAPAKPYKKEIIGFSLTSNPFIELKWFFLVYSDYRFMFYAFLLKHENRTKSAGLIGKHTEVIGKCLFEGDLDFQTQQAKIVKAFNIQQESSILFRFLSSTNDNPQNIEIDFVSRGAFPCEQVFRFEEIPR